MTEWGITAVFGVASLLAALLAGREWRLLAAEIDRLTATSGHRDGGPASAVDRGAPVA